MRRLLTTLTGMFAILATSITLGFAFEPRASEVRPTAVSQPANAARAASIALFEVKEKMDRKDGVLLVDARPVEDYRTGRIKGAISLPLAQFEERYPQVQSQFLADTELIVYCSGSSCGLSSALADALLAKGHSRVRVFSGGWPEWLAAGYPTESGGSG